MIICRDAALGLGGGLGGADTVALDLELTHELRLAGLAREIVRLVQEARKNAGSRSPTASSCGGGSAGSPEPAEAIRAHGASSPPRCSPRRVHEGEPDEDLLQRRRRRARPARLAAARPNALSRTHAAAADQVGVSIRP